MTGSLNKAFLIAALALSNPAWAQQPAQQPMPPHDLSTAPDMDDQDSDSVGYTETPPVAVNVEPIDKLSIDGFGTLDENSGGIPKGIWSGSTRDTADFPLMQLDSGVANEVLRNLLIRVLMTQSAPPEGRSESNWFTLRVRALIALGLDDKAIQMISALPPSVTNLHMVEMQTELELARGNYDKACATSQPDNVPDVATAASFWQRLKVLCQTHKGEFDQALLGVDLLNETHAASPLFEDEIRHMANKSAVVRTAVPKKLSLFDFAVIRMAKDTERLKDKMDVLPAIAIKYLADDKEIDIKLRDKAIARAMQLGILPPPENSKAPEQPFEKSLASDVTTLVTALGSGNSASEDDNQVIARLALDDAGIQDSRRVERLLTLMELFGWKVPESTWQTLLKHTMRYDGEVPAAMWMDRLNQAANANRKGETVVIASLIFADQDTDKMSDLELIPVVKSLKLMGFEKEARDIAYSAVKNYK